MFPKMGGIPMEVHIPVGFPDKILGKIYLCSGKRSSLAYEFTNTIKPKFLREKIRSKKSRLTNLE